jgi:hypothetical protein
VSFRGLLRNSQAQANPFGLARYKWLEQSSRNLRRGTGSTVPYIDTK